MLTILKYAAFGILGILVIALFDIVVMFTIAMIRVISERKHKKEDE